MHCWRVKKELYYPYKTRLRMDDRVNLADVAYSHSIRGMEVIMAFFDDMKNAFKAAGQDVTDKAKEVGDTARVKVDIHQKQEDLKSLYVELGHRFYEEHQQDDPADAQVERVRQLTQELDELNESLLDLQGNKRCPNCGFITTKAMNVCGNCGHEF